VVGRSARYGDDGSSWLWDPRGVSLEKIEGRPARASAPLRTCQVQRTGYFFFFAAFFFVPFFFAAFFLAAM
jgi:hypothetical protein